MAKPTEFPEEGELVVGTVREVQNFGAFVTLEEYPGKEGFCHIAEVASGWVKRIRDHVREQQRVVCKVLNVDARKGHIDLSMKRVNDHQRRETIQLWKNEQKADKLFEIFVSKAGGDTKALRKEVGFPLADAFGTLYQAFEEAAVEEADALQAAGFKGDWLEAFIATAKENIQVPFVDISGYVEVTSHADDGVEHVRKALVAAQKGEFEDVTVEVHYIGAPLYRVTVRAPDYKIAEDELKKSADRAVATIEKSGGKGAFHREMPAKQ